MAKYAKLVNPLRLWTEVVRPSSRGKMADFSLMFDEKVYPNAPLWVETFYAYAPGGGVGVPNELPSFFEGKEMKHRGDWGQHSHDNFDELFLFFGTDPTDNTRLGGEVEIWLGHGEDAQKYMIRSRLRKWVPKGVAHNPWIVTKVDNPKYPMIMMVIAFTHTYSTDAQTLQRLPSSSSFCNR